MHNEKKRRGPGAIIKWILWWRRTRRLSRALRRALRETPFNLHVDPRPHQEPQVRQFAAKAIAVLEKQPAVIDRRLQTLAGTRRFLRRAALPNLLDVILAYGEICSLIDILNALLEDFMAMVRETNPRMRAMGQEPLGEDSETTLGARESKMGQRATNTMVNLAPHKTRQVARILRSDLRDARSGVAQILQSLRAAHPRTTTDLVQSMGQAAALKDFLEAKRRELRQQVGMDT